MPAASSVLAVTAIAGLAGGAMGAYGQYSAGQEQQQMSQQQAGILDQQAALDRAAGEREAGIIGQNAVLNEYRQRKEMDIVTGRQVAGYAKSGVSVGTGSPLDFIADSIANAELEISIGQWNAKTEADTVKYNAEMSAQRKTSEASLRRQYGESAAKNAMWQSAGTLLNSAGTAGYRLSKEKIGE